MLINIQAQVLLSRGGRTQMYADKMPD